MLSSLEYIYIGIVIISFLCSLISFRPHQSFHLKLFSALLGITVITEIIANFFLTPFHLKSNFLVYSIYMLIEYPLLAFYFKKIITSKNFRQVINVFLFFYPTLWFIIFFFVYNVREWNSFGIMAGDLFIIIFASRYLYELFTSEKLVHFRNHTEFWIAVGLIFYSCCELPITGILNFHENNQDIALQLLTILQILNIIMYSVFIYAFLCRLKLTMKRL
jgi:hypothetical protein